MYSQQEEEKHILEAVGDKVGLFLDIGAWHPKTFSNTRALFERGWSGVLIEPSPEPFLALLKEYGNEPRIKLVLAAIGPEELALLRMHATADAVSTTDELSFKKWESIGGFYGSFYTPALALGWILAEFGRSFQFVNIDAEGCSVDLLESCFEYDLYPQCICVEFDDRKDEAIAAGASAGYAVTHDNGTNLVLVRQ